MAINSKQNVWQDIPRFKGKFEASITGMIRNKETREYRKPYINDSGYFVVGIYDSTKKGTVHHRVHRLIAETFIPNPDNKRTVNHIDGNKLNNKVDNLEWATHRENLAHARNIGLVVTTERQRKTASENIKKNRLQAHPEKRCFSEDDAGNRIEFPSIREAAVYVQGSASAICLCCQGKKKTHKGFRWGYC